MRTLNGHRLLPPPEPKARRSPMRGSGPGSSRRRFRLAIPVVHLGLILLCPLASWAQSYDVTLLDFPGAIDTFARGINQQVLVVAGYGLPGAPFRGFVYDGLFSDFVVPGSRETQAWTINGAGHI